MDERVKIAADGPKHGGVVQFANWPWPGVCMRGDVAIGRTRIIRAAADLLVGNELNGRELSCDERHETSWAIYYELHSLADEFMGCKVDTPTWIDRVARGEGCA